MQLCDVRQRQRCVFSTCANEPGLLVGNDGRNRRRFVSEPKLTTLKQTPAGCYPEFRARGLFVGSGVIEAGCKAIIGYRLKASGMFWTVRGANNIIALRC